MDRGDGATEAAVSEREGVRCEDRLAIAADVAARLESRRGTTRPTTTGNRLLRRLVQPPDSGIPPYAPGSSVGGRYAVSATCCWSHARIGPVASDPVTCPFSSTETAIPA